MSNFTKDSKPMIEEHNTAVPWKVYEKTVVLNEAREKRKDIIIGILIFLLFVSNGLWVWYMSSLEFVDDYTSIEAEQDGGGVNIVGGGDVDYGTEGADSTQETNDKK